tara:strand:+ start:47679 stop:49454 length:1776 start_codon:yes stop_codon:yes gene_type:complete
MQGNFNWGRLSSVLGLKVWVFIGLIMLSFSLKADDNSKDEQRKRLIEMSLQNSRNPQYLDSLASALLQYEDKECQARGFFLQGLAATFKGEIDKALPAYKKSLNLIPVGGQYDERFTYYMVMKNVGIAFYRQNMYAQGDSLFQEMMKQSLAIGDSFHYASALSNLGNALNMRQDFDGAIKKFKEVILIEEALGSEGVAASYLKVGTIFGRMSQPQEALIWFQKALVRIADGDIALEGRTYNNIAVAWRSAENLDSAQFYLLKALAIHKRTGSKIDEAVALENLAKNAIVLQELGLADSLLTEAYKVLPSGDVRQNSSFVRLWLLSLSLALEQGNIEDASNYFARLDQSPAQVREDLSFLKLKAGYFELKGNQDSAIYYLKVVQAREAELNKANDAAKIKREANAVELAEIDLLRETERKEEIYRYSRLALSLLIIGLLVVFWQRRKAKKQEQLNFATTSGQAEDLLVKDQYQEAMLQQEKALKAKAEATLKLKSKAVIKVSDILYVQSEGHYVNIYLVDRENPEVERISLAALLEDLGEDYFQRIHRSYAVNISQLKAAYSNRVLLSNGTELPVTRTYNSALQERFNKKES